MYSGYEVRQTDTELLYKTTLVVSDFFKSADIVQIDQAFSNGYACTLMEMLKKKDIFFITSSLKTVNYIVDADPNKTKIFLDLEILISIKELLGHKKAVIVKDVCLLIKKMASGHINYLQAMIDAGLMENVIDLLTHVSFYVKREALLFIEDVASFGLLDQILYLVAAGILKPLCNLLFVKCDEILLLVLQTILKLLSNSAKISATESVKLLLEEYGGLDRIESLQEHIESNIYNASSNIIKYFSDNTDVMDYESRIPIETDVFLMEEENEFKDVNLEGKPEAKFEFRPPIYSMLHITRDVKETEFTFQFAKPHCYNLS